jgi:hypothetical protein
MEVGWYTTFKPANSADRESDSRVSSVVSRVSHAASPDYEECNGPSIRWLCRRGPVPSVYNWDPWSEG